MSILLLLAWVTILPQGTSRAADEEELDGYSANTLTIEVGYPGGPSFVKHVFTLADLEGMDIVYADYTFIDYMPSVIIAHIRGVRLADVIDAAGIDVGSVRTFHFWIGDKTESFYTSFSKQDLLDTPRYCYYSLPDNFDYDLGEGNEYATSDAQRVDTLIALGEDWNRALAGATFGSDYLNLSTRTRFRLVFGQTDSVTRNAARSAKWVYSIVIELRGEPGITLNVSDLDIIVGTEFQVEAAVEAADPVIADNAQVVWSSSDDRIVSVDDNGKITAIAEGEALITAEFLGAVAFVNVTSGVPDPDAEPGSGSSAQDRDTAPAAGGRPGDTTPGRPSGGSGTESAPTEGPSGLDTEEPPDMAPDEPPPETEGPPPETDEPPETEPPPEPEPPETEPPPDEQDIQTVSIMPIIGIAAIFLFAGGSLLTLVRQKRSKVLAR